MSHALQATAAITLALALSLPAHAAKRLEVLHSAITDHTQGTDLEVSANVRRYGEVRELNVRYRAKGAIPYKTLPLRRTLGDFFEVRIPAADVQGAALEYYLELIDRDGNVRAAYASAERPQVVNLLAGVKRRRTALEEEMAVFAEEQVFSAAKQVQRIEESPSAITVITAEDIRNYGSTSVAEVLRTVPGIDYMQISGADPNIAARGFNRELSNRLLTLIDGRSAYVDVFGMTFWEVLPISVWEIDRIEVIRGPGSTLYGANAFGGVVNIYTKSPEKARGMHFYTQGGDRGFNTTLLAAGSANKWARYRLSVTHDHTTSFDRVSVDEKLGVRGNGLIELDLPDGAKLALRGGLVRQSFGPTMTLNGPFTTDVTLGYAQLNLDYKSFRFQTWYTGIKGDLDRKFPLPREFNIPGLPQPVPFSAIFGPVTIRPIPNARPDTVDVEANYTLAYEQLVRNTFGVNYRFNQFFIPALLEPKAREHLLGVFDQVEIRPHATVSINAAIRMDLLHFTDDVCALREIRECLGGARPRVGVENLVNLSPRGALVWGPTPNHYLRLSAGVAFRNPAFVENLIRYEVASPSGQRPAIIFAGNEKLGAEQVRSYEIGYGATLLDKRLRINLDLFYLSGHDLIQLTTPLLLGLLGAPSTYLNLITARNYGLELSVRASLTRWLKAFFNYSYQKVELIGRDGLLQRIAAGEFPGVFKLDDLTTIESESPMNKLNFGVNVSHEETGFFLNLYGHFVGASRRRNPFTALPDTDLTPLGAALGLPIQGTLRDLTGARAVENIDAYFLLNANLGYRLLGGQLELGVAGFNLLGAYDNLVGDGLDPATGAVQSRRHLEYPRLSIQGQIFGGELIGARVYAFLRGHFR
jgi:iron complex outermembrane receptor protein